ncbi:MAG TPA: ribonuclease HI family protein [Candidatus Dojkabacteria bacterium]|jgi:ribonuclease HI
MYKLFTDGGARGNPGPAGLGAIIFDEKDFLVSFENEFLKNATNNQAEYLALILGLKVAAKLKIKDLKCHLDSELAVKQINGEYRVKNEQIAELKSMVDLEIRNFEKIEFVHIKREKNKFADKLVNLAMDNSLK